MVVGHFVGDRRRAGQHPQPTERIHFLVGAQNVTRNRSAADAVEAVTTGDEVAVNSVGGAVLAVRQPGRIGIYIVRHHVLGLIHDYTARGIPGVEQVAGDLGLSVDRDVRCGQVLEVDAVALTAERHSDTLVSLRLPFKALVYPRLAQQGDRALLDDPGPYATENVVAALPLQYHAVDSTPVQKLGQKKAGRAGTDDANLRFHARVSGALSALHFSGVPARRPDGRRRRP